MTSEMLCALYNQQMGRNLMNSQEVVRYLLQWKWLGFKRAKPQQSNNMLVYPFQIKH